MGYVKIRGGGARMMALLFGVFFCKKRWGEKATLNSFEFGSRRLVHREATLWHCPPKVRHFRAGSLFPFSGMGCSTSVVCCQSFSAGRV